MAGYRNGNCSGMIASLHGRKMSVAKEPMLIKSGWRYSICPTCKYEVRIVNAPFANPELRIRDKTPVFGNHGVDGAKVTSRDYVTCISSYTRPISVHIK